MINIKHFLIIFLLLISPFYLFSQEEKKEEEKNTLSPEEQDKMWDKLSTKTQIFVIGENKDDMKNIPGSATLIDKKFLRETQPVEAMEVLRRVPGASVRFMDSAGLTPNIGFRGVSNEESRKTLFLEDGILVSLSPYGQPESYYFPQIDRMERVEVVKGSGAILFGPSTIGGVINFITRKPPKKPEFSTKAIGGENGYFSNFTQYGGTFGKTALDVSFLHKHGDGFRDYNFFNVNEGNIKIIQELNEKHSISLKIGIHQQKARASYHGITQAMFWKSEKINPAEFDYKQVDRNAGVLGHEYDISKDHKLITKAYASTASRDWQREDFSTNNLTKYGVPSPPPANLYRTYAAYPIGNRPGDIMYMKNSAPMRNQGFQTGGVETKLQSKFKTASLKHKVDMGLRVHGEKNNIDFLNPYPDYPFIRSGYSYSQQERLIRAYAAYFQDRISLNPKWKIIPGARYENVSQGVYTTRRHATAKDVKEQKASKVGDIIFVNQGTEGHTKIALPGFGITYDITNTFTWFSGVHKGFSPPTFGTAISPYGEDYRLSAETSTNYETGLRGDIKPYLYTELVTYVMFFRDQIINTSEVANETGSRPINSGNTLHRGFESSITFDFGKFLDWSWELPLELIYTYTKATSLDYEKYPHIIDENNNIVFLNVPTLLFDQHGKLINPDTNGKMLPYVPEHTGTIAFGARNSNGFYIRAEYQYVGKQYASLSNYRQLQPGGFQYKYYNGISYDFVWNTNDETPDGNTGVIPELGLVNASIGYRHPVEKWSLFINAKNLQDRKYVSGRLPVGIQPGPTRQINAGMSIVF
ncbi:MAG: TonB-dependent receptor [Leptospiraceae bacterium]|nr:TonB-dependent receptor [Leptospiraceae bacterium]